MKLKLTKSALDQLDPPAKGRLTVHDTATPGLAVQITSNNARSFYTVRWRNGKVLWVRLGAVGELTLDEAKRKAREAGTLGDMWETYRKVVTKGARTMEEDAGLWRRYLEPWEGRRIGDITEDLVQTLYTRIGKGEMNRQGEKDSKGRARPIKGGATAANRMAALLSGMYSECARSFGMAGYNPARGIRKTKDEACDRYLSEAEFPAYWTAMQGQSEMVQDLIKLALFTWQRRTTLIEMRWSEVNLNFRTWTIPASKMKGGKAHTVPLVPQAVEILERRRKADPEGEWVFASPASATGFLREPKKALTAIYKAAGIESVTLHDLRRTAATWANSTGASEATIAAVLAHRYKNVTGIYAKATADTMRTAMEAAATAMVKATQTRTVEVKGKAKAGAA